MIKLFLIFLAVLLVLLGYYIIDTFIVSISFLKYFTIEVIISGLHMLYNQTKNKIILNL